MTKVCMKDEFQNPGNKTNDFIMLKNSAHGTLCSIHNTLQSTDTFPCSHKMIQLCPVQYPHAKSQTRIPISRSRRKSRSPSPCQERLKMYRAQSATRPCTPTPPHIYCTLERSSNPEHSKIKFINVEKTSSCPEKMYCNNSTFNKAGSSTYKSSIEIDQFTKNLTQTDLVIDKLRGEIEQVKHQLHHISRQKLIGYTSKIPCLEKAPSASVEDTEETPMTKLKNENKRLKREIESKKKLLLKAKSDVAKAKDILADYEKKVSLLHIQAVKSSRAMKLSKEMFCNCLKEKDESIKTLRESHDTLEKVIRQKQSLLNDKEKETQVLNEGVDALKKAFEETCQKCSSLNDTNQNYLESIDMLRNQLAHSSCELEGQKETIQKLEQKICDLNRACKGYVTKAKREKESFGSIIKSKENEQTQLSKKVSELSQKLEEAETQKRSINELQCECHALKETIKEYETFSDKCKLLKEECMMKHEELVSSQNIFKKDKHEMEKLIHELTGVVKQNKETLLHMSAINKQQENIIMTQSMALLTKEEQLMLMEKDSEDFKRKNTQLEEELRELKKNLSEPCSKEACICVSKELNEMKKALSIEKDTHLMKEKIIEDQSETILHLQYQVKEKMNELEKAESGTKYLEEEIGKINEKLIQKHHELDMEVDEKENLIEKLRDLECQKNQLCEEINDFEDLLQTYKETCGDNVKQQMILHSLEEQIFEQKKQWELQKQSMAKEKQKAVCVAKFATQKLLDTVADFQRQVDAQKKVQLVLTKMLHEKDEQLRCVKSKISNINNITQEVVDPKECNSKQFSMKEIFVRNNAQNDQMSDQNTSLSMYSSCSSCCKKQDGRNVPKMSTSNKSCDIKASPQKSSLAPCANMHEIIKLLSSSISRIPEEPSRDLI